MKTKKQIIIVSFMVFLNGCSMTPVVIDNKDLYLGVFKSGKKEDSDCNYIEIEGVGLKMGISHFGIGVGYFDLQTLVVMADSDINCNSKIANVYLGKLAEEKAQKLNNGL